MKEYKTIYDKQHNYYKTVPDINIPEKYKKDIKIEDLWIDYNITYCNINIDDLPEAIGDYHLRGENSFNKHMTDKQKEGIIEIYLKPKKETIEAMNIIKQLTKYTLNELKTGIPEQFTEVIIHEPR